MQERSTLKYFRGKIFLLFRQLYFDLVRIKSVKLTPYIFFYLNMWSHFWLYVNNFFVIFWWLKTVRQKSENKYCLKINIVRIQLQCKMASPSMQESCNRRGFTQRPSTAPSAFYSFDSENSTASNTPRPSIYTISKNSVLDDRMWASQRIARDLILIHEARFSWQGGGSDCEEPSTRISSRRYAIPRGVARIVRNLSGRRRQPVVVLRPRSAPFCISN